jgi:hypothetical protein
MFFYLYIRLYEQLSEKEKIIVEKEKLLSEKEILGNSATPMSPRESKRESDRGESKTAERISSSSDKLDKSSSSRSKISRKHSTRGLEKDSSDKHSDRDKDRDSVMSKSDRHSDRYILFDSYSLLNIILYYSTFYIKDVL